MRGHANNSAHQVLDYIISRALLEGKTGETEIEIPLLDFVNEFEGVKFTKDALDLVLKVRIKTSWDEGTEENLATVFDDDGEDAEDLIDDDDGDGEDFL